MTADSVPAADAIVWTMLFSWTVWSPQKRRTAIEMTAAGIDVANVKPTFRPRYTFAAVNTSVIMPPMMMPRRVSSLSDVCFAAVGADTKNPFAALSRYPARVEHVCAAVNGMRSLNLVFNCSQWGGGGCFVCGRVILRGCVALLPACPVDLRCPGCSVVEYSGKVACPSGRRCSTRNAVWCHSHPGFKSQRYRHCRPAPLGPGGFVMPA